MAGRGGRTGGGIPRRRDEEPEPDGWQPRSTVRMEQKERLLGAGVAGLLALFAVLFLAVHPPHGHPQPRAATPIATIVICGLMALSLGLSHRIITGILSVLGGIAASGTPHLAHSVIWLRKVGFAIGVIYALYLTLQQAHAQRENRYGKLEQERRDKGLG